MLQKLFKPKWKHSKPAIRREALMAMAPSKAETQAILTDVINTDDDLGVRRLAVKRSTDLTLLKQLADDTTQSELSADASKRLSRLLAGQEDLSPPLAKRLEIIANLVDPRIDVYLLKEAPEAAVRLKLLARIERQAQLGDIAINDADAEVRLAAAERIAQRSTLERVAKQSRRKDKAVFALLNERLNADSEKIEQRNRQGKQLKLLCAQMDALQQTSRLDGRWLAREAEFNDLRERWPAHVAQWQSDYGACDEALVERFQNAQSAVQQALAEKHIEQQAQRAQQADVAEQAAAQDQYHQQLKAIADELQQCNAPTSTQVEAWSATLAALREQVGTEKLFTEVTAQMSATKSYLQDVEGLTRLLAVLRAKEGVASKGRIEAWRKQLAAYQSRPHFALNADDLSAAQAALEDQQNRLQAAEQLQVKTLAEIEEKLQAADTAVNAGEIHHADKLLAEVKNHWADVGSEASLPRYSKLTSHYQRLSGRIKELNDWRRWSTTPVLEELVASVEALAERVVQDAETQALDYADVAQRVRDARAKWKAFGAGGVARSKVLWGRFDQACNTAYAPCQVYFAKQGEIRFTHLQQRESTCDDLQAYLTQLKQQPADEVDWQVVAKIIQTARQEWAAMGTVERKQFLGINKRFNRILADIHTLLATQRNTNLNAKTQLIKQAERLANEVQEGRMELRQAIDDVKTLQSQWKSIGPAEKDRTLWTAFRENCDRIFRQRDAQRDQQQQAQEAQNQALVAIIERLEGLSIEGAEQIQQPLYTFEDIKREWSEQTVELRRNPLQKRFERAAQQFQQTHKSFLLQQKAQVRQHQQQMAELCVEAENLLWHCLQDQNPCAEQQAALQSRWQALPEAADALSGGIAERFKSCMTMLNKAVGSERDNILLWLQSVEQQNRQRKEELCLRLEVLCGAESPEYAKQARVTYQVSQLEKKMRQGDVFDRAQQLEELLLAWHKSGMLAQALVEPLMQRFDAALAHCTSKLSDE